MTRESAEATDGITTASWIADDERASDALSVVFQSTSVELECDMINISSSEICQGAKGWLHLATHHPSI